MINQKNHKTFFQEIQSRLTRVVLDYATPTLAFEDIKSKKILVTFERNVDGEVLDLVFDSRAHVELWAESCAKNPDLVSHKFEKRMVV